MEYLQPKELTEAPKYYKNPAGVGLSVILEIQSEREEESLF